MTRKLIIAFMVLLVAAAAVFAVRHVLAVSQVASAYYAKTLCSGVFVSGRAEEDVIEEDVLADLAVRLKHFSAQVNRVTGLVTSSLYGFSQRRALYRSGLGCTLVNGVGVEALKKQAGGFAPLRAAPPQGGLWPQGERVETGAQSGDMNPARLRAAMDRAFAEPREETLRRTRAVVVVHKGRIAAERYAPGISPDTPLTGWSMGKTITGALAGILAGEGKLSVGKDRLFPQWTPDGDPRAHITLDHLLRMTSGLDFDSPHARMLSDVRRMLFLERDAAAYALEKKAAGAPGSFWLYGSCSTSLVSALIREQVEGGQKAYFNFPHKALFAPLGMRSAVLEPDASGTFLSPAFVYATARDWARFGLFLLNGGVWQGERILPEGWVDYLKRPTQQSDGYFGAHVWRKVPGFLRPRFADEFALPEDRFYMLGHDGQMVAMVPSRELVVVRLGVSRRHGAWDPDEFLSDVLQAFGKGRTPEKQGVEGRAAAAPARRQGFNWGRADQPER